MVKDHSDSEKGNPLPPHGLLFPIRSKGSFICITHRQDNTYHGLCYTSRGALAGTKNSSMGSLRSHNIHFIFGYIQSSLIQNSFLFVTLFNNSLPTYITF